MKSHLLLIALMLTMLSARAEPHTLATINDPTGDDNGAGSLIYPQRSDFHVGDLDLLRLQIDNDKEGFWFDATFKNLIRNPENVVNGVGGESLANFARKGFYQFNLDIYVDTDRVKGSGNTFTLPGRQVRIDPSYAWEKAVILTPRPEVMRQQLLDTLAEQYPERTGAMIEASVDKSIFFPTRIRVNNKSINFFVPASFFEGSDGMDWAITAFVTGAIVAVPANFSVISSARKPLQELQLGVMQPALGHPQNTFGYGSRRPNPVVDLLGSPEGQREHLEKNELVGVAWGSHAKEGMQPVASSANNLPAAAAGINIPTATPLGKLLQPGNMTTETRQSSAQTQAGTLAESPSIAKRLQTLQQLLDQKLINEDEYKQQKQRILQEI